MTNNEFINPIDVRTEDEHNKRLERWKTLGLLNYGLMDGLLKMTPEEITSLETVLNSGLIGLIRSLAKMTTEEITSLVTILSNSSATEVETILNKYSFIEGIVTDTLEVAYNDDESSADPDNSVDDGLEE